MLTPADLANDAGVCHCNNSRKDGFMADPNGSDLWVHVGCGNPTAMYLAAYLNRQESE